MLAAGAGEAAFTEGWHGALSIAPRSTLAASGDEHPPALRRAGIALATQDVERFERSTLRALAPRGGRLLEAYVR